MAAKPFHNMAVSLSGGGYRATTFHLGALGYLDQIHIDQDRVLERVKIISTISGGTLTGVMYALKVAQGGGFQDCFDRLYHLLSEDELVEQALHKLNHPGKWKNEHKTRDLINAFAEVYDTSFYEGATFGDLFNAPPSHLTDAIFGSSEFTYGIQFRLQEEHGSARFGNGYLNLPKNVAEEVRLADAAAASSCFPGGFEPMIMPDDFGNGPDSAVDKTWLVQKSYPRTALMDGGIIDNQGIEGVKLVEDRHASPSQPYIGTYIVSDVSGDMMKPYKVPELKHSHFKNFFTLNNVNKIALALMVLLGGFLFIGAPPIAIIVSTIILTMIGIWFIIYYMAKGAIVAAVDSMFGGVQLPEIAKDLKVLLRTPIYILVYLIKFRASSVVKMVMDVFLRRIRRLQLNSLYDSNEWDYRFKSNYIYSLSKDQTLPKDMQKIVLAANTMPTTLWFTQEEKDNGVLDDLIACGQFTQCFNLIKYTERLRSAKYKTRVWDPLSKKEQDEILALEAEMEKDWTKFEKDPYWLLDKNKTNIKV